MYGWIEPSCVNKNFSYTNDIDIVFRSSSFSNNIVLGNEYPNVVNAAIYITSNCIGIQKVPDSSQYGLDIDARASFKYIDIGNFSIDESKFYSENMNINCNGLFDNILTLTNDIKKQIKVLNNIQIISIDFQNNKYYVEFAYTDSLRIIQSNLLLKIQTELYIVTDLLTSSTFVLQPYFINSAVTQLEVNDIVTIYVYQDLMDNTYNINVLFTVTSYAINYFANSITIDFEDIINSEFLLIDKYYIVFDNIFILKSFDMNTSQIVLYSLYNNLYTISSGARASMQYIDILIPETINENNVLIGTYTDATGNKLLIQNSQLSNMINDKTNCVRSIIFNKNIHYNLSSIWVGANSNLVADISNTNNTSYIYSTQGKFSYNILAYPLRITGKGSSGSYIFDDILGLFPIWDINLYNMLFICNNNYGYQINDIDKTTTSILFTNILDFEIGAFLYVIPYSSISNYTKLGKSKYCYISGKLAIGTSNPVATETLTVNGNISCNNCVIFNDDAQEEQFTLKYDSNAFLVNNSIEIQTNITTIKNDLIVEGNLAKQIRILNDIQIISIDFQNNKYYIEFAYTDSLRSIQSNQLLKIQTELYIVTDLLTSSTFVLQPYFTQPYSVTQLTKGEVVTIHVYQDVMLDNTYNINVLFTVISSTSSVVTDLIEIEFENMINSEFLLIDKHYIVFDNIFILKSFDMNTSCITLYSLTNSAYPIAYGTRASMQYIDLLIPETINENNVLIGTYTDDTGNKLLIQNSQLSNMIKDKTNCVNSILFNNSLQYELLSIWVDANSNLVADFSNINNTSYIYSTRGKFSYNIVGYPLRVIGKGSGSSYVFDDILGLFSIWDINVYNMLFICNNNFGYQINDIDKTNTSILFSNILNFDIGSYIYVIPYSSISNYTKLGKSRYCYISGKLAIGTLGTSNPIATETLTVNGNISCNNCVIFNGDDAHEQFTLKYDSNAFLVNNSIEIQNNITTIKQDLVVEGNLTSSHYLTYSDRKLKRKIHISDPREDLSKLQQIKIYDFKYKNGKQKHKGVMAQELQKQLPFIIKQTREYMPSVCKYGHVTNKINCIIVYDIEKDILKDLLKEKYLRIFVNGKKKDVYMEKVHIKKNSVIIFISENYKIGTKVYIHGPLATCKTIDTNYLLMMLINSIKLL